MLQGNPYDTEKWIEERTEAVRQGVAQTRLPRTFQDDKRPQAWRMSGRTPARLRVQRWWVPAAFALGTLLGRAIG
jgi:hypothetical protein